MSSMTKRTLLAMECQCPYLRMALISDRDPRRHVDLAPSSQGRLPLGGSSQVAMAGINLLLLTVWNASRSVCLRMMNA
ncbi:hypothetical protein RSOLAG22IIIB_06695 [Rhizoctonia solani]|uniref:Uncharacterized protein n=1 Tax=Rhizoctonia solani TaxID=456999 RepID=A0A0K6GG98_9AGAM|nr:hypothetical protein RSOLAG22IIIB_06695 [Rhizoctonia solani]